MTEVGICLQETQALLGSHAGDSPQGAKKQERLRTHVPVITRCPDLQVLFPG